MTRDEFLKRYPNFAATSAGSAERKKWLAAHPVAAGQWGTVLDLENRYGANWGNTAYATQIRSGGTAPATNISGGFQAPATAGPAASAPAYQQAAGPAAAAAAAATETPVEKAYDRNAYAGLKSLFGSYGLESLAPKILEFVQGGYTQDTVEIMLRETPEYKARFPALAKRQAAGLNAISVGRYLDLENEYTAILKESGLPSGFYDDKVSDFSNWIAGDKSPDEVREQVSMAQSAAMSSDPGIRQQLSAYYGLGEGDLVAYFLDPSRATTIFDKRRAFGSAEIGAAGAKQGVTVAKDRAMLFEDQGLSGQQAAQGFAQVAAAMPDSQRLSSIYDGQDIGQKELEDEYLGGMASAQRGRQRLADKEVASFSEGGGVNKNSLRKKKRGAF